MALPEEALACAVARYHFKPIVGETVRILFTSPGSTISRVSALAAKFCEKNSSTGKRNTSPIGDRERTGLVRDALAVLVQHGIAYARDVSSSRKPLDTGPNGADASPNSLLPVTQTLYYIDVSSLLFRPRLPLYLGRIRRSYGDIGEAAFRAIFERGRLTAHQIFKIALTPVLAELDITVADAEACLDDMAKSGLLHWCGRRTFSHNSSVEIEADANVNGKHGPPQVGMKRVRPSDMDDTGWDSDDENDTNDGRFHEKICVGRGQHSREVGAAKRDNDVDIWGICYWHLNRGFRIECCALTVQERISNDLAVKVLRAGLQLALDNEDCEQATEDFETADVSTDSIQKHLEEQHGAVSVQEFWDATQALISQTPAFVLAIPEHAPTTLRFIPGRLISDTRQKTLEDLVTNRYGRVGHRVFRSMLIEGGMEEKMLAEKCLLPLKVVREHLFRMYQDRIVVTQEVPRSNDQQRASNWYYLWTVNPLSAYRSMLNIMYKTITNLFVRLGHLGIEGADDEKQQILKKHETLLTASILRVDQSIMVMRDFGSRTAAFLPTRYTVVDGQIGKVKHRR